MEHLTKQQIVLLTLLVSFMTSIATGIVTISLINQAPAGATNTVEQVIENTVAGALPSDNVATVVQGIAPSNSLVTSVAIMQRSIVKIQEYGASNSVPGLGVVVNSHGAVMTDKSVIAGLKKAAIAYPGGKSYQAAVIESQQNGDLVFLQPLTADGHAPTDAFIPVSVTNLPKLGQTAASLGGTDGGTLGVGVIDELIALDASSTLSAVSTTIDPSKVALGSPLFDISGSLIGIFTSSMTYATSSEFYLIAPIKAAIPK